MKPSRVFQIYIRTTPDVLWNALTDGAMTEQYYFGTRVVSSWQVGDGCTYQYPNGEAALDGTVLEFDPPHRLRTTFHPLWQDGLAELAPSTMTYEIEPQGNVCKLTVTLEEFVYPDSLMADFVDGQAFIYSGLKTLLETGMPMAIAESEQAEAAEAATLAQS